MISFSELPLRPELLQSLNEMNFTTPTPIQQQTLPILLEQTVDFIGQAQTGTGKTAAFGLPLLQKIDTSRRETQALVLCPTRELCLQAYEQFEKFGAHLPGLKMAAIYGGAGMGQQTSALRKGIHIVLATPGRLIDHLERGNVHLDTIRFFVLDEADRMLDMGFLPDVERCLDLMPSERNIWLFSATMPREIRSIANRYMSNPAEAQVGRATGAADAIDHRYAITHRNQMELALKRLMSAWPDFYGIVFTRTKSQAQDLSDYLLREGFPVGSLHGDMSQEARTRTMQSFRDKALKVLCATDVAARGLDVNGLTHVIHFGMPQDNESFVHRSGRTARAGRSGMSLVLTTQNEFGQLRRTMHDLKLKMEPFSIPRRDELAGMRLNAALTELREVEPTEAVEAFLPEVERIFEGLSREDILRRIAMQQIAPTLIETREPDELNAGNRRMDGDARGERAERGERPDGRQFGDNSRFKINVGRADGFQKMELIEWISQYSGIAIADIRHGSIQDSHMFFSIPAAAEPLLMDAFQGKLLEEKILTVEAAEPMQEGGFRSGAPRRNGGNRNFGGGNRGGFGGGNRRQGGSGRRQESMAW
jgi:ATP-dependent RNA helicase DeaD